MATIIFTTCNRWPDLYQSDQLVANALATYGHEVAAVRWQDDFAHFQQADLIVFRAHWDYHHNLTGFSAWLERLDAAALLVQNALALVRWNLQKSYLLDLQAQGIIIPTTALLTAEGDPQAIYRHYGWERAIIKPLAGASGHLVERVAYAELDTWQERIRPQRSVGVWLIQEFRPEIAQGEISLIFINGAYSHAVVKQPDPGEFRITDQQQGQISRADPAPEIIDQAQRCLTILPEQPLYARVDGVVTAVGDFCLIELELNEPVLYFRYAPEQALHFAEAIHGRLA